MPRRNHRRPATGPATFRALTDTLKDEWAVRSTRATWSDVRAARKAGVEPGTPAFSKFLKQHAEERTTLPASKPVSINEARAALAIYLG